MKQSDRQLYLLLRLRPDRSLRARDLAASLEVSERTVYRDIASLAATGVPVVSLPGEGYRIMPDYYLPPLHLSVEEGAMLLLGAELARRLSGQTGGPAAATAAAKLREALPAAQRDAVEQMRQLFGVPVQRSGAHFDTVCQALTLQQALAITYYTASRDLLAERVVEPYAMQYYGGAWHLVAFCRMRRDIRDFRVDRIRSAVLLGERFERPVDFDADVRRSGGPGPLQAVVFVARAARQRALESLPPFCVEEEEIPDGYVMVFATDLGLLVPWVLSLGPGAEVLQPDWLRLHVANLVRATVQRYVAE